MRDKLTRVTASISANAGRSLWKDTLAVLAKLRGST